ncbi:rCG56406 [Rattus norvegicus]|uniref:RCG56406 n=1 Tax=Rattus norvegicus TaxID=10116 RepID=A6IBI8_RAT|nr:rCG56406 [Rattus norvegicus]
MQAFSSKIIVPLVSEQKEYLERRIMGNSTQCMRGCIKNGR